MIVEVVGVDQKMACTIEFQTDQVLFQQVGLRHSCSRQEKTIDFEDDLTKFYLSIEN